MKHWLRTVIVGLLCLLLCSCAHTWPATTVQEEVVDRMERCQLSDEDVYMVYLFNWFRDSGHPVSCDEVTETLEAWRRTNGPSWQFLTNPAREGSFPVLDGVRAFGVRYSNSTVSRTVVVDVLAGRVGSSAEVSGYYSVDNTGVFIDVTAEQIADLKGTLRESVVSWTPVPGWPWELRDDYSLGAESWQVPLEGWSWDVTICMEDYGLYRFEGVDSVPEGFQEFVETVWSYVL